VIKQKLRFLYRKFKEAQPKQMGFPINGSPFDLSPFYKFVVNNLGDPFCGSAYGLNTLVFEKEVIKFFANLYHLEMKDAWGYVTSGGSEGNLKGLYLARQQYNKGVAHFSDRSHYSVFNAAELINLPFKVIKSNPDHSINIEDLKRKIDFGKPIILSLNVGTTMKGAIDDIGRIIQMVGNRPMYCHVDAALSGLILPFINGPKIDFKMPICSMSVSGHKMLGCSIPCGVFLCRKDCLKDAGEPIEYINSSNNTIFGSRSGLAPLAMWCGIKRYGKAGLKRLANNCMEKANYIRKRLGDTVSLSPSCNTVVFPCPSSKLINKYHLSVQNGFAHIIVMPHLKKKDLDGFISDMKMEGF